MKIHEKIQAYHDSITDEHHRYCSWEHCYGYFQRKKPEGIAADKHHAALQLGFYLASWGMYRGSSFLLQHAYTVHLGVIDQIVESRFSDLWEQEFGAGENDTKLVPIILEAVHAVRGAYKRFAPASGSRQPTDTLVTKVLLGTFGCLPACDRYFIDGFETRSRYSYMSAKFIEGVVEGVQKFARDNLGELQGEQSRIERDYRMRYPIMKLIDMYFWQIGYERDLLREGRSTGHP